MLEIFFHTQGLTRVLNLLNLLAIILTLPIRLNSKQTLNLNRSGFCYPLGITTKKITVIRILPTTDKVVSIPSTQTHKTKTSLRSFAPTAVKLYRQKQNLFTMSNNNFR